MNKQDIKKTLKLLGLGVAIAIIVFVALDFSNLWQNLKFNFIKPHAAPLPKIIFNQQPETTPNTLAIPSLGIKAPIQYAQTDSEKEFQALLENGVVHYPTTAMPGEVGNDYIFGHSSDYIWSKGQFKNVFALLPNIKVGDTVLVSDHQGNLYTYRVTTTKVVAPSDTSVLSQDTAGKKILTVQTSYPVGTALKRFVAICELVP